MATSYSQANIFERKPYIIAIIITLLLVIWMASGMLNAETSEASEGSLTAENSGDVNKEKVLPSVEVMNIPTISVQRSIELYGRTEPDRMMSIGTEVDGRVADILVAEGQYVKAGQKVVQLAVDDKLDQLNFAKALVKQREIEYSGAKSLQAKGLQGESLVAAAAAGLEEAKALVRMRETQVQKTNIVAPFDGFVQSQQIELGSIVNKGQQLFELVDLSPLVVTAYVTENDVAKIKQNANVEVTLVDGKSVQGKVRFLSSVSDTGTNTFPIEIEIENPVTPDPRDMMKAGISTEVKLMFDAESAIKVSPALLSLDKAGNLGVKTVDGDTVVFTPIDMIKAEQDGVWLGGFSGTTQVITRGQGFVRPGDKVNAVLKQAGN